MTRYHIQLTPYFRSEEYQGSHERKMEKSIEDKCKSIIGILSKIWNHPSDSPSKKGDSPDVNEMLKNQNNLE